MSLSSSLGQSNEDKQRQQDYAHHSIRRQRFREEANRVLLETYGKREEFGRRVDFKPKRRLFSFRRAK